MKSTFEKRSINQDAALQAIQAGIAKARSLGIAVAVMVVDESGVEKAFLRMDGAPLISVSAARSKALTAVGFGMKTGNDWFQFIKDDPILLHGAPSLQDFTLLGGGLPLLAAGTLVGAVGVSGGHYSLDEQCAAAAVEQFGTIK